MPMDHWTQSPFRNDFQIMCNGDYADAAGQFFYFILGFRSYETSLEGVFTIPQDWNCDFFIYTFN